MRRPTFSRWAKRLILELADTNSFSLRKLAASAQKENPRLAEPLLLYAYDINSTEKLLSLIWDEELRATYTRVLQALGKKNLTDIALEKLTIDGLPREYVKILNSYRVAYQKPETLCESKKMRWERSRALQLEKGISAAEIYHALGLNPGNVNAYLKHGALDKVSLDNATSIMKFLYGC